LQSWQVGGLGLDVIDAEVHVDDRLGRQAGNRGRAHMVDPPCDRAERGRDPVPVDLEGRRPGRVVGDDHDLALLPPSDQAVLSGVVAHAPSFA